MTALAATDVTVTLGVRDRDIGRRGMSKNMAIPTILFGDGALTYPAGGIPLPAIGKFGFQRQIDFGSIEQPPGDGLIYKYDRANHKLRVYSQGVTTGSTAASTASDGALAEDENAAETAVRFYGTAIDTSYNLGPLHEVGTSFAPASTAMKIMFLGE